MTICKECAKKRDMFSLTRVKAKCELCGELDVCIDVHHSRVPVLAPEGLDPYLRAGAIGHRVSAETTDGCVMRGPKP